MIAIDLSKQEALDIDPKAIQRINLRYSSPTIRAFIIEEIKETILNFRQGIVKVL